MQLPPQKAPLINIRQQNKYYPRLTALYVLPLISSATTCHDSDKLLLYFSGA